MKIRSLLLGSIAAAGLSLPPEALGLLDDVFLGSGAVGPQHRSAGDRAHKRFKRRRRAGRA
jgi:hypothetical protein